MYTFTWVFIFYLAIALLHSIQYSSSVGLYSVRWGARFPIWCCSPLPNFLYVPIYILAEQEASLHPLTSPNLMLLDIHHWMQEELRLVANVKVSPTTLWMLYRIPLYIQSINTQFMKRGENQPSSSLSSFFRRQESRIIRVKWLGWCIRKVIGNLTRKIGSLYIYCLFHLLWFIRHTKGRYPNYKVRRRTFQFLQSFCWLLFNLAAFLKPYFTKESFEI